MLRRRMLAGGLAAIALASAPLACGVRAPAPLDVAALVRAHGAADARARLAVRILDDPRDVQARLALARLADEAGRPSEAIEQLEAVLALGGPLGTRWHDDDRARMARLLAARGRARLAREAPTALADLERAGSFGAAIEPVELLRARAALAVARLRHVDAKERERGRAALVELSATPIGEPAWLGAKPAPVPRDRGLYGAWLWERGARRAAWEALAAWRATAAGKGDALHDAYLRAFAWWHPIDAPPPIADHLFGAERCRFAAAACEPGAAREARDPAERRALLASPLARTTDPAAAAAWVALALPRALAGELAWGPAIRARVDVAALDLDAVPAFARPVLARLAGRRAPGVPDVTLATLRPDERLVVAAARALDGAMILDVRTALGAADPGPAGRALLALLEPPAPRRAPSYEAAVRSYVVARSGSREGRRVIGGRPLRPTDVGADAQDVAFRPDASTDLELPPPDPDRPPPDPGRRPPPPGDALDGVLDAYRKDPVIADRRARDLVAEATDAAEAHARVGALFDALADPARARAAWEAAVASSAEPAYVRGLALACARANDPDAALVHGTTAAAASGDPAEVWLALARALDDGRGHVQAMEAARYAIDLAGADLLPAALDAAITASEALGRRAQADQLRAQRARLAPAPGGGDDATNDPTDPLAALAAHAAEPSAQTIARLWTASRWNPRDVALRAALYRALEAGDPRRRVIAAELVTLAGDRDAHVGRRAVAALR